MNVAALVAVSATSAPAGGSTDWVRLVGLLGLAGVWVWRGLAAASSSRHNRQGAAVEHRDGYEGDGDASS